MNKLDKIILVVTLICLTGCVSLYRTPRVHIPQQTKAHQLQVEAAADVFRGVSTSVDASYSLTENFVLTTGGALYPIDDLKSFHFGVGALVESPVDWIRISATTGVMFQRWRDYVGPSDEIMFADEQNDLLDIDFEFGEAYDGFDTFDAEVVMPFAQTALVFGPGTENFSVVFRVERPTFQFSNVTPTEKEFETEGGDTIAFPFTLEEELLITSAIVQVKSQLIGDLSALLQVRAFQKIYGMSDSAGFDINNDMFDDLYVGLSYLFNE